MQNELTAANLLSFIETSKYFVNYFYTIPI